LNLPGEGVNTVGKKKKGNIKIGRDAGTGRFIPVKDAQRRPNTTVVETIRKKKK